MQVTTERNRLIAGDFLHRIASLCRCSEAQVLRQGRSLMALAPGRRITAATPLARSILNNDGGLLEACLTSDRDGWTTRLIADPAADCPDPLERYARARASLESALGECDAGALAAACERTLQHLLADDLSIYDCGPFWIAAGLDAPGVAVYCDAKPPGSETAWNMARAWLADLLTSPAAAQATLKRLQEFTTPASFGIEGSSAENARLKIYFRLRDRLPLPDWAVPIFSAPAFVRFLQLAIGERELAGDGLVGSVSFRLATGELADGKIDLCACTRCLNYPADRWVSLVQQLEEEHSLAAMPIADALRDGRDEVAFIGFGLRATDWQPRLNVYLKPNLQIVTADSGRIRAGVIDAIRFLQSTQEADGCWTDYQLPVGASDQWVTGYVGLALAEAGQKESAERAAAWLCSQRSYAAGWGFNATTGPDVDSTAFVIRLLQTLGRPVRDEDLEFLAGHWQAHGGFATYQRDDAWGEAHPDVTPVAFLCLSPEEQGELLPGLLQFLRSTRLPSGMWPSYWWSHPFYSTYLVLSALETLGAGEAWLPPATVDERYELGDPFNLASLVGIQHLREQDSSDALRALLALQNADGSWDGGANLRVTDTACRNPWRLPAGETYTDMNRNITTATALKALSLLTPQTAI